MAKGRPVPKARKMMNLLGSSEKQAGFLSALWTVCCELCSNIPYYTSFADDICCNTHRLQLLRSTMLPPPRWAGVLGQWGVSTICKRCGRRASSKLGHDGEASSTLFSAFSCAFLCSRTYRSQWSLFLPFLPIIVTESLAVWSAAT